MTNDRHRPLIVNGVILTCPRNPKNLQFFARPRILILPVPVFLIVPVFLPIPYFFSNLCDHALHVKALCQFADLLEIHPPYRGEFASNFNSSVF